MAISRVNGAGFGVGDKFTAAHANGLDLNTTYALDKRSGQTDTLSSIVTLTSAGRLVWSMTSAANADTTYTVGGGNLVLRITSAVTLSRSYTLSATGAVAGDEMMVFCETTATVDCNIKDQSANIMFVIGNSTSADGQWATFLYTGSTWELLRGGQGSRTRVATFTGSGSQVVPRGVTSILAFGCGGGGGGGGGCPGIISSASSAPGGGGGGGAPFCSHLLTGLTPGGTITVTIGNGGTGGTSGNSGTDGNPTTLSGAGASTAFPGAQGGVGTNTTFVNSGGNTSLGACPGGIGVANTPKSPPSYGPQTSVYWPFPLTQIAGQGGYGISWNGGTGTPGAANANAPETATYHAGGSGAAAGTQNAPQQPGGGGGGGGAGPFGAGANAGSGGASGNIGGGASGNNGSNASANTGAGGGGGGGGGCGSSGAGGNGGVGGTGGSGKVYILWVK